MTSRDPWRGDWRARVYERARALGYTSVRALLEASPAAPYRDVARRIPGGDIAPVQLEKLSRAESIAAGTFAEFARDCLARYLRRDLPEGWPADAAQSFDVARAYASWAAALFFDDTAGSDDDQCAATLGVLRRLEAIAPTGWLPDGADDPRLLEAFDGVGLERFLRDTRGS